MVIQISKQNIMSLTKQLLEANNASREKIPAEALAIMDKATGDLLQQSLSKSVISNGSELPIGELTNTKGEKVNISSFIGTKPLVISFYRGGWCPYCNIELKALQNSLSNFKELGAELIAITPETPDNSLTTKEKNELEFEVLSDINNIYAKSLGLVFEMPEDLIALYHQFGLHVDKHNENKSYELPMPATFVIDVHGKIILSFVKEDYTKRLDPNDIIASLQELKSIKA